ncbi:hypothetical protein BBD42_02900 [Paenibacillus sp. BIHB 4019]|uniref:NmrA-like domain-containing protein n=1 Tax=Paenibacillus sp. BIHB 4019 TaxID=1870819 RepID=A0A1B2DCV1_9BACL|nr:SDR family oxidoreductase [Paenibacillus sp. BIHB 4019]ANY65529.1 hypothetical protein BBD42_02900 [Paenibacillus sp. BIHB 4019]
MNTTKETILVTGAGGNLGRLAVQWLLENYDGPIIAATRTPEKLSDLADRGVSVRHADFNQAETLTDAFAGVQRLLLVSTDALEVPGQRITQHSNAIQAAVNAGVKHIVYTSFFNPEPGTANLTAGDHYSTEEAIKNSGLSYTILRSNLYAENLLQSLTHTVATGQYAAAIGEGKIAYVTRKDCAHTAAAALASSNTDKHTRNVTGPEALSGYDIAQILSDTTKKNIIYIPLETSQLVGIYESFGVPNAVAHALASFDTASARGEYDQTSTTVQELTGQAPTSLKPFLDEYYWKTITIC